MGRLALVLALTTGCSAVFMQRPSSTPCSRTRAYWIADFAATGAAVGAGAWGQVHGGDTGNATTGVAVVTGIVAVASALNGYRWEHECRAEHP